MEKFIQELFNNWQKRNICGFYCADRAAAVRKILEMVPGTASIGFSGSQTLEALGIIKLLGERKNEVFNPYKPGLSREESLDMRTRGAGADYYLASANAISGDGKLVFLSAYGHRIAGIASAKNVIVVCGTNKIAGDLSSALKRAREYATPLNCRRLEWKSACLETGVCHEDACFFPEYKRMCCQALIIEAEIFAGRIKVVLVDEKLGF